MKNIISLLFTCLLVTSCSSTHTSSHQEKIASIKIDDVYQSLVENENLNLVLNLIFQREVNEVENMKVALHTQLEHYKALASEGKYDQAKEMEPKITALRAKYIEKGSLLESKIQTRTVKEKQRLVYRILQAAKVLPKKLGYTSYVIVHEEPVAEAQDITSEMIDYLVNQVP